MNENSKSFWNLSNIIALIAIAGAVIAVISFYFDLRSDVKILSEKIKIIEDKTGYSKTSINQKIDSLSNDFSQELSRLADTSFVNSKISDLSIAEEDYRITSRNFNTAINQYDNIVRDYESRIRQLSSNIDLYIPDSASSEGRYLEGIIQYRSSESTEQGGVITQPVRIIFNDSILPIVARNDTLRVRFIFSQ